jgi:hypothetical protein
MKGLLFDQSKRFEHEQILKNIAQDLYEEMISICKRMARYGKLEVVIDIKTLNTFQYIENPNVYRYLREMLGDLVLLITDGKYYLSWAIHEVEIPHITSRDLIELGYPLDMFGGILKELKSAKAKKEVAHTLQAEILWIKKTFILNERK